MSQRHLQLGQNKPTAAATLTLYTTPALTVTMISSIVICNVAAVPDTVRVFVVPSAGSADTTNAIIYDMVIPPGIPFDANIAVDMNAAGFISTYSLNGNCVFTVSGLEIS